MSHLLMPVDTHKCATCDAIISADKKYCSRKCYYNRFTNKLSDAPTPIEELPTPKEEFAPVKFDPDYDPLEEQLVEEGIIISDEDEEFCEVCGAAKYLGRCSRFTQHKAPKKPKSR